MIIDVPSAKYYSGCTFFSNYDIPLQVIHVEDSPSYPDHYHDFEELIMICGGSGKHIINGKQYDVRHGDIFFIRRGIHHEYPAPCNLNYINILFDEKALLDDAVTSIIDQIPESGIRLGPIELNRIKTAVSNIDRELYDKRKLYTHMARSYLMQLICIIHRAARDNVYSETDCTRSRIERIIRYLDTEDGPDTSIGKLAEEAGTCTRNFHRVFRDITGMSPNDYINRLRIKKACELLAGTDISVTGISAMVNLSDSNYFARLFKSLMGTSPSSYRKNAARLLRPAK